VAEVVKAIEVSWKALQAIKYNLNMIVVSVMKHWGRKKAAAWKTGLADLHSRMDIYGGFLMKKRNTMKKNGGSLLHQDHFTEEFWIAFASEAASKLSFFAALNGWMSTSLM